jgi:hypothetical protein
MSSTNLQTAYASEGAKQFDSRWDRVTGQWRGLNEPATMLFSDPARANWIAVVPWRIAEGEVLRLDGQFADFTVTWAQASAQARAA